MTRWKWRVGVAGLALLLLVGIFACGGGGGSDPAPAAAKVNLSGQVTGSGGIEGVKVSAGGRNGMTDANGYYRLDDVPVPDGGRLVLTFEKAGYATYQRSLPVEGGKSYAVPAQLTHYDVVQSGISQTAAATVTASDGSNNLKVRLDLPADALIGAAPGNVEVSLAVGDPSTAAGRATFPGDYMAAASATAEPATPLISVAFAEITIRDANGKEIKELSQPADLTLRLPEEFQAGGAKAGTYVAGDPQKGWIEWWSYDEVRGVWIEEDADPNTTGKDKAEVVDSGGILFARAKVKHFTWWNADHPVSEHACYDVTVVDGDGAPLSGIEVVAQGVSYNGTSYPALTGADGKGSVTVKRSTAASTETIKIKARTGNIDFFYQDGSGNSIIDVTQTEGSTIGRRTGQCVAVGPLTVSFDGTINGTVTYENSGKPAAGVTVYSSFGPTATTGTNGAYSFKVPVGAEILLFVPGLASKAVTVASTSVPATVDFILPNRAPVVEELVQTPNPAVLAAGSRIAFGVTASDPDGDPVTYAWSATAGIPTAGTGPGFNWTVPAGEGTAQITVTVTDDKGAATSSSRTVIWGGSISGTSLKVTIKNDPLANQPVSGAVVVLHGSDSRSVQQTIVTGADGIADFGDIGRVRATVTIGYEETGQYQIDRDVETFVGIQAGNLIYYIDDGNSDDYNQQCANASATVNLNVTGIPSSAQNTGIAPGFAYVSGNGQTVSYPVCADILQNDGLMGVLGRSETYEQSQGGPTVVAYGYLLDQTVVDSQTYNLVLNRVPVDLAWSTTPATSLNGLQIYGVRKGLTFSLAQFFQEPGFGTAASFGTLKWPGDFPAEEYLVEGTIWSGSPNGTSKSVELRANAIGTSLDLPVPDYDLTAASFDGTDTFTWSLSGNSARDLLLIELSGYQPPASSGGLVTDYSYSIAMSPTATTYTVVELPAQLAAWVTPANLNQSGMVRVIDFSSVGGFDETFALFRTGGDPQALSNRVLRGERYIDKPAQTTQATASKMKAQNPPKAAQPSVLRSLKRR